VCVSVCVCVHVCILWMQCSIYELRRLQNRCQVLEIVCWGRGWELFRRRGFIFIPRRDSLPETCEKNQYLRFFRAQWAHHDRIRQMQMTLGQKGHHFPIRNPAFYPLMAPAILAGIKCG